MTELFINGQTVDLFESQNPIATTYVVNDIAEIKDRDISGTGSFKLPATLRNREILGYPDAIQFVTDTPYRLLPAEIRQDGITLLRGSAIVQSAGSGYELQIVAGSKAFFDGLGDKKLEDLMFPEHTWNFDTIKSMLIKSSADSEVFYPFIDYGMFPIASGSINAKYMYPAIWTKAIVNRICKENGYTVSGDIFTDQRFVSEFVPFARDTFEHSKRYMDGLKVEASGSSNPPDGPDANGDFSLDLGVTASNSLSLKFGSITMDNASSFNGTIFTAPMEGTYNVKMRLTFDYGNDVGVIPAIDIRSPNFTERPNTGIDYDIGVVDYFSPEQALAHISNKGTSHILDYDLTLFKGQQLDVSGLQFNGPEDNPNNLNINITGHVYFGQSTIAITAKSADVVWGQPVQPEAILPDVSQKNFLKDWMQRYALVPIVDPVRAHVTFRQFGELYKAKDKAVDWTDKILTAESGISFRFNTYAKKNYVRYKKDDGVSFVSGDSMFEVRDESLKEEGDYIESIFAPSDVSIKMGSLVFGSVLKIKDSNNPKLDIKTLPRVMTSFTISKELTITDGTAQHKVTGGITGYFNKNSPSLNLDFQNLLADYYSDLINNMLNRTKIVTRYVMLNAADIASVDHFIPVYDRRDAQYYYLNKIADYIPNEPAKVELIRM